jgi:hypothetical protein
VYGSDSLGRFVQGVTGAVFVFSLTGICAGCGGGITAVVQQPQAADFSVAVSSSSVTISQGGVSAPVNFSIIPQNGFSGTVQLTFASLPAGISSNPASPFMVTSGVDTAVNFGAATTASTGSFTLSAQAVSGEISHSTSLTIAIQASSVAVLPRTNFVRTDATPLADNPPGEAHHRRIVYDPAHKYVFIANAAMNRLEVISAVDQSSVARISIPRVTSADLSADGTTVWAGTGLNEIVAVDSCDAASESALCAVGNFATPGHGFRSPRRSSFTCYWPVFRSSWTVQFTRGVLALWDPASNVTTDLTPAARALFQNGWIRGRAECEGRRGYF